MIDQLIKLVAQNAGDAIVNNQAIPNKFNNAAIEDVAQQIFGSMQGQVSQGNMQQILAMFTSGGNTGALASNPMVAQIVSGIAASFASKFGVSPQAAQSIAYNLVPQVLNQFINKTNDPGDRDFDLQDVMRGFSGNSNLNVNDILNQVTGGSANKGLGGVGDILGNLFGGK